MGLPTVREDEIYLLTKSWLLEQKFEILGGQPPNGTDRFPVIEIKSDATTAKGSKLSYKPDLVVATPGALLIIECKPVYDEKDVFKLREIALSKVRLKALVEELRQRKSLERREHLLADLDNDVLTSKIRFCVAYSGHHHPAEKIYSLVFDMKGTSSTLYFGSTIVDNITHFD